MRVSGRAEEPLLIEYLARLFGFEALSTRLPADAYPPYLYVGAFVAANFVVGQGVTYARTGTVGVVENPFGLTLSLGVVLAALGIRYMTDARGAAVESLLARNQIDGANAALTGTVSLRTKLTLYVSLTVGYLAYEVAVVGVGTLLSSQGPILAVFYNVLIIPLGFLPVAVEFVLVYAAVHVTFPRQLSRSNLDLFFFDARNLGGFRAVGTLLKRSYYVYTAGLLLYLAFFYGPVVVEGIRSGDAVQTGVSTAVVFTVLWLVGLLTLAHSVYVTHRIMAAEKDRRLGDLESELETAISDPHDIGSAEIVDQERLESVQFRLDQVRETSEYPTTFTMWVQIGVSVLLPQLLQLSIQAL